MPKKRWKHQTQDGIVVSARPVMSLIPSNTNVMIKMIDARYHARISIRDVSNNHEIVWLEKTWKSLTSAKRNALNAAYDLASQEAKDTFLAPLENIEPTQKQTLGTYALINIDYDEFDRHSYRAVCVGDRRFDTGDVAQDFTNACKFASAHFDRIGLSSDCDHFVNDTKKYRWIADPQLGEIIVLFSDHPLARIFYNNIEADYWRIEGWNDGELVVYYTETHPASPTPYREGYNVDRVTFDEWSTRSRISISIHPA